MHDSFPVRGKILITGGTSGLGLELVKLFLEKGFHVVATGRQPVDMPGFEERFRLFPVDFSNLGQTATVIKEICETFEFDYAIYNAGILSPPGFTATADGFEYTYQVNFLAHLLINEVIIKQHNSSRPLKIAVVTSPVYRIARPDLKPVSDHSDYTPVKAYSDSKLFLLLMCRHFAARHHDRNITYLSFTPGIFGSGIYRMQSRVFRMLYNIAKPFMRKPGSVARVLGEIMTEFNFTSGEIYDRKKRINKSPGIESSVSEAFWKETCQKIEPFLG